MRKKTGWHHSEETKRKIRESNKRTQGTDEKRKWYSEINKGEKNPMFGKHPSEETRRKNREAHMGKKNHFFGKHHSKESREKIGNVHRGKIMSRETRRKIRISVLKHIEKTGRVYPGIGKDETKTLNILEKHNKIKIERSFHIKKLGYFVDGYCKKTNTVYEVDESYHFNNNGNLREKDLQRQKEIEEELNCNFIRIKV